jgi:putative ABC transport system permease protein
VKIFDNTFKISFQLALITLLVASLTLYTNLITVRKLRRQDLLPLFAIGIPMNDLLKLDIVKNVVLTLLVSVFSVFMGLIISYILSSVINPNAFGWEIPLRIFPLYWVKITIVALIIATVASSLSLRLELKIKSVFYQPIQ